MTKRSRFHTKSYTKLDSKKIPCICNLITTIKKHKSSNTLALEGDQTKNASSFQKKKKQVSVKWVSSLMSVIRLSETIYSWPKKGGRLATSDSSSVSHVVVYRWWFYHRRRKEKEKEVKNVFNLGWWFILWKGFQIDLS